ncbi:hypothetical protein ACFW5I_33105 [Streptomyces sp. NPDC058818]|uniref:hypothetical protein n=1 Tax=Streptomyces sp. NPDC058818 TaxID=3346640 RepID=UPI0036AE7863
MINPSGIPQFTGDFDQLDKDVSALRSDAIGIRDGGSDVHSRFQMLEAFYTAPEAETLFATTQPVMDKADTFATDLETVADALDTFSIEARPLAKRLDQLKRDAITFVNSVDGDDDWTEDEDKVDKNSRLLDDVTAAQSAFREAERRAATKISAIVGGPRFVADDGSGLVERGTVLYGYDTDLFAGAEKLPWGTPEDQTYEAWSLGWFGHGAKSLFWDGIYKDGIEATAKGVWALGTGDGEAWSGLKDVVTGIGLYTMKPYDALMDWAVGPDKESADEVRAKKATKEFGKALVAWDMWQENPTRAAGTVIFNVLTLGAGPLAVASRASKGGLAGKTAGVAAKAGLFMDPVYVGLRGPGAAVGKLPKLSEVTAGIRTGIGASSNATRTVSVLEFRGAKVMLVDGRFLRLDEHNNVIADTPPRELPDAERPGPDHPARDREPAGMGARGRSHEATNDAGGNQSPQGPHNASQGSDGGHTPGGSRNAAAQGSGGAGPSGSGQHDGASSFPAQSGSAGSEGNSGAGSGSTPSGSGTPRPVMEWQADDNIVGPARGKLLLYPNSRHDLSGVRGGVPDTENTVILPETKAKVREDIAEIAAGRAQFDPKAQRYTVNGRKYAIEPHGRVFPVDGPGLVQMNRVEYSALKAIMRANGDMSKVQVMFTKAPQFRQNPQAVEKAIGLYRKYYS